MPRVLRRPHVDADLDAIWDFIADDNIDAADRVLDRIGSVIDMLAENPQAGRARPELAQDLRSFPVGNYVVFYFPIDDGVDLVRILSGYLDISPEDME